MNGDLLPESVVSNRGFSVVIIIIIIIIIDNNNNNNNKPRLTL